jgi:predicted nucleic acid-binding protein
MQLLISDANVLIDMEDGNLIHVVFRLNCEIMVPDILFESELKEHHEHLLKAGLKVKSLSSEFVEMAETLGNKHSRTSVMDRLALALAMQERCCLLTGDKDLRIAAIAEGIVVHGTVLIVEELLKVKLIEQAQAKESFASMKEKGRRLPWGDIDKMLAKSEIVRVTNE